MNVYTKKRQDLLVLHGPIFVYLDLGQVPIKRRSNFHILSLHRYCKTSNIIEANCLIRLYLDNIEVCTVKFDFNSLELNLNDLVNEFKSLEYIRLSFSRSLIAQGTYGYS